MADREVTSRLFTKRRKAIKLHQELRQDPKYRSIIERSMKERKRVLEALEAKYEIKEYFEK